MSHADVLLAIIERERRKLEVREVRYFALHDALRRAHERELRSAQLIERAEALMARA